MEEMVTHSARLTAKVTIPSRSLTAVTVQMKLPPCKNKTRFDFTPIQEESLFRTKLCQYIL